MSYLAGKQENNLNCTSNDFEDDVNISDFGISKSILIVDDSPASLRGLARILGSHWNISVASSAEEATTLLAENKYGYIISDCDMSGHDGLWLLSNVCESSPDTVRILVSAGVRDRFTKHLESGLIQHFFAKPIQSDELLSAIK